MIHDAQVEVTCDGKDCDSTVFYQPHYVYPDYSGEGGHYDVNDDMIEAWLESSEGWTVSGDKHYCDKACVPK